MFVGAQISLYPMTDGFVPVILSSLTALDPWRSQLQIETDDISTLIVGALVASAGMRADRRVVDKALLRIAQFCCGAYILALLLTILAPGIAYANEIGKEAWAMLAEARPWLLLLQGVVSAMLGVFFSQSFLVEKLDG